MPASFRTGSISKRAGKIARQTDDPSQIEDEHSVETHNALTNVAHATGDTLHRTVLQLQRTIGNQAVKALISHRAPASASAKTSIQRAIAYDGDGAPKLATLYDMAYTEVWRLVENDTFPRWRTALKPANNPAKTKSLAQVWADEGLRNLLKKAAEDEFSPENINFLLAVDAYNKAPTQEVALSLYNTYIKVGAESQVNISSDTRSEYDDAELALRVDVGLEDAPETRARGEAVNEAAPEGRARAGDAAAPVVDPSLDEAPAGRARS